MIHQTFSSPWVAISRTDLFLIYDLHWKIRTSYNRLVVFFSTFKVFRIIFSQIHPDPPCVLAGQTAEAII